MNLTIERLDTSLPLPTYAHEGDSGMDLYARPYADHYALDYIEIEPMGTVSIGVGIRLGIPDGYEIQIRPRSGMTREGIITHFGTVDSGYRGEVMVNITNTNTYGMYRIYRKARIAQAILAPVTRAHIVEGVVENDTERGSNGFGSTGK